MRFSKTLPFAMLIGIAVMGVASAQDAPSPSSPANPSAASPPSPPSTVPAGSTQTSAQTIPTRFYLEVSPEDLQSISVALNELPKKIADPLITKLNAQLQRQAEISSAREQALKPPESK